MFANLSATHVKQKSFIDGVLYPKNETEVYLYTPAAMLISSDSIAFWFTSSGVW